SLHPWLTKPVNELSVLSNRACEACAAQFSVKLGQKVVGRLGVDIADFSMDPDARELALYSTFVTEISCSHCPTPSTALRGQTLLQIVVYRSAKMSEHSMADDSSKKLCFVIGPIGSEGSDERRHADWLLNGIVRPVFAEHFSDYKVERADKI